MTVIFIINIFINALYNIDIINLTPNLLNSAVKIIFMVKIFNKMLLFMGQGANLNLLMIFCWQ
jgi:hypothetical protein